MVELVILSLCLAGSAGAMVLAIAHVKKVDERRLRRSMPTSERLAQRRQFRGFEHDLLVERELGRRAGDEAPAA